jgi:hypothetical protein
VQLNAALAIAALLASPTASPPPIPPSTAELAAITDRGRMLADYDAAAWHASDALTAIKPDPTALGDFIAQKGPLGWIVAFGRLSDRRDSFSIAYEATQSVDGSSYTIKTESPQLLDTGFFLNAARAVEVARQSVNLVQGYHYNYAVLPADDGKLWVYFYPGQTQSDIYLLGGDTRFLISGDGTQVLENRRMHNSVLELPAPREENGRTPAAGMHSEFLADEPEDSDVFFELTRRPAMPEFVRTPHFLYQIGTDGNITVVNLPGNN